MLDWRAIAQWVNANKDGISTAADVVKGLYDEITTDQSQQARIRRDEETRKRKEEIQKKKQVEYRRREEKRIEDICLPLILKAARNQSSTPKTMIISANIDYKLLQCELERKGYHLSIFTLHTIVPLCSLDSLACRLAIYLR